MKTTSLLANRRTLSALVAAAGMTLGAENAGAETPVIVTQNDSLTYITSSVFNWDLNANTQTQNTGTPVYDQVISNNISNKLTVDGTFAVILGTGVTLGDGFWNTDHSWTVFSGFNGGGGNNGTSFATITQPAGLSALRPGAAFSIGAVNNGAVTLSYTGAAFVPEPTSALAGGLLAAGLLRRRRR